MSWTELDIAIPYTSEEMALSGSAVVDTRNSAGFAAPGETALVAVYTSAKIPTASAGESQSQSLAYSLDDGTDDFRDPKVFWYGGDDGHWVMIAVEAVARRALICTSADLIHWTHASRFGPAHATDGVWECPDLFPLVREGTGEIHWLLVISVNPGGIAGGSGASTSSDTSTG